METFRPLARMVSVIGKFSYFMIVACHSVTDYWSALLSTYSIKVV